MNEAALAVTRDPQTVRRWEQGRFRPSRAVLVRLAALYGTDVADPGGCVTPPRCVHYRHLKGKPRYVRKAGRVRLKSDHGSALLVRMRVPRG